MNSITPIRALTRQPRTPREPAPLVTMPRPLALPAVPVCPLCKGDGWLRRDVPYNHPMFGKPVKCACTLEASQREHAQQCYRWTDADDSALAHIRLESFNPALQRWTDADGQVHDERARYASHLADMRDYADRFIAGQPCENVLLKGSCGTGKTLLACGVLNACRDKGIAGLYCTAQNLLNVLYAHNFDQRFIRLASTTPLLVLDEIDKYVAKGHQGDEDDEREKPHRTNYQQGLFGGIFNSRYLAGLPTFLISNEQHDLSPWLDEWTLSRFLGNRRTLEMNGRDCRQKEAL